MPEQNVLSLTLCKMAKDGSPWYQERGKHAVHGGQPGEFYVPDGHAIGLQDIAAALGINAWQLNRLRNPKHPEYDPEVRRVIRKRDGEWTASYQDLFCAIVRRARYTSAMRSRIRRDRLRKATSSVNTT